MQLFNTLTRTNEQFTPQQNDRVTLYTCGLTVYDFGHIGNFRTFLFYDVLRRALEANNYSVLHVMNITDVGHLVSDGDDGDDKLEKGAAREGKTAWEVASYYTEAYRHDRTLLNILPPSIEPKATEHIAEQIALIQTLETKGFTYAISDGVYFDTSKLADYGKLAQLDIEGLQAGARVEMNPEKRNTTDFALWKLSPQDGTRRDMEWESPWGIGFPGWHLECSAMAMKYCGETLDIHCGGIDHIPVHHTNEIAQSEAATQKPFANMWMHSEFLLVDGGKMSKSLGNFYTVADLIERGYNPLAFRYFTLGAHYRSKLNFTFKALDAAASALSSLVHHASQWNNPTTANQELLADFDAAINNDLNTAEALAVLWSIVKGTDDSGVKAATVAHIDRVLGLRILEQGQELRERIAAAGSDFASLLEMRADARAEKDWETSDRIRNEIQAAGFIVEDTPDGQILRPA